MVKLEYLEADRIIVKEAYVRCQTLTPRHDSCIVESSGKQLKRQPIPVRLDLKTYRESKEDRPDGDAKQLIQEAINRLFPFTWLRARLPLNTDNSQG